MEEKAINLPRQWIKTFTEEKIATFGEKNNPHLFQNFDTKADMLRQEVCISPFWVAIYMAHQAIRQRRYRK